MTAKENAIKLATSFAARAEMILDDAKAGDFETARAQLGVLKSQAYALEETLKGAEEEAGADK